MMGTPTKFCKDCKWARRSIDTLFFVRAEKCAHPELVLHYGPSPVTGKTGTVRLDCDHLRRPESSARCGLSGRFWEPRP